MVEGQEEGKKFDESKVRTDLVPISIICGVASVLTFGANKYGDRNWEQGIKYGRVWGALLRHLYAWWEGEQEDPESGLPHLWHAASCLSFIIHYETYPNRYTSFDDRPTYEEETEWKRPKPGTIITHSSENLPPILKHTQST